MIQSTLFVSHWACLTSALALERRQQPNPSSEKIDENHTRYITEHYFRFDGWGMKVMAFLMPSAFKKQSMQYLKDFKAFAEGEI